MVKRPYMGEERNQANHKQKKQSEENIIKNIRNLFKLKNENETIKGRIIRNSRTLFEQEND